MKSPVFVLFLTFAMATLGRAQFLGSTPEATFATRAEAEVAVIPAGVRAIRTLGYYEPGEGGASYVYAGTAIPQYNPRGRTNVNRPDSHYLVAKGGLGNGNVTRYYLLAETTPNVQQFGAIADGTPSGASNAPGQKKKSAFDNTTAFNDALSYGKGFYVPEGAYWIVGTVKVLEDGVTMTGAGAGGEHPGGTILYFGGGTADCVQFGDGVNQQRWGKITRLAIDARNRTGGNAIFAFFDSQLVISELRIVNAYDGILLFRGLGYMVRDVLISGVRAGDGTADAPREIGYCLKVWGAPVLYDKDGGKKIKRDGQVVYVENLSFGSAKQETDPSNWTVGLWCAENAASVNGATVKNQNVRRAVYLSRAASVDPTNKLLVPEGYRLVPATRTDAAGKQYAYGTPQYPSQPGTVVDDNGKFQDLTLFYLGGDFLGGEFLYDEEASGVAIYNPHFMRSYQGNSVYMGPNARDLSIYGGQIVGPFKHGCDMNGVKWQLSGVQIYKASLDESNRQGHKALYSAIHVGATSVGGDIANCKIGNEPAGTPGRAGDTVKYGLDIAPGAQGTWYHGNRFEGCIEANVNNGAGSQTQGRDNFLGPPSQR